MLLAKRVFDILISLALLIVLAPLLAAVAVVIALKMGGPVLFRQERPGLNGRLFVLCKFRTMSDETGPDGRPLSDAQRLTPLGRFLRSTSLDELPELVNVLKGDMSLVGPRPLLPGYLPYYTERERLRHAMRPGITGWAQVCGRNRICWDRRLEYDAWYVEHWSALLDLAILIRTAAVVLRRSGVVADPSSVMRSLDDERRSWVRDGPIDGRGTLERG